jgi:hypothetical protein
MHMQPRVTNALVALLAVCLLVGCKGYITSQIPLVTVDNASYPFPVVAKVEAQTLDEHQAWQAVEGKAQLSLIDGAYRVTDSGTTVPSSDTYLFKRITDKRFIAQASNGHEWAYGLIERADRYYLFTFDLPDQNCTNLSSAELRRFNTAVRDDVCYVSSLADLSGLLLYLRQRFPHPVSSFIVAE